MEYSLIITDWADELLDNIIFHLLYRLKNQQAASHLLDNVEKIYEFLKETPYQILIRQIHDWVEQIKRRKEIGVRYMNEIADL